MLKNSYILAVSAVTNSLDLDLHLQTDLDLTTAQPLESLNLTELDFSPASLLHSCPVITGPEPVIYKLTFQLEPEIASSSSYYFMKWAIA